MGRINGCKVHSWIIFFLWLLNSFGVKSHPVDITIVESAVAKGAVCLDGGPPAYHFSPGFGAGVNNWFVTLEGGGWCNNVTTCLLKRDTRLGSSKKMATPLMFSGILGKSQKSNPDFFDWNKVKVRYCDGSSFTGDVEAVDPKTNLHYRGARIFQAIMDELLAKGMSHAEKAILAGCSAGGLASILHCDKFRSLLPSSAYVKCLSDAGYFINAHDISGAPLIQQIYNDVVNTHQSAKNLPSSCTTKMNAGLCFFPENVAAQIQTPLFLLNAAYDSWQIKNILAPGVADPHGTWSACKSDIRKCSPSQIQAMQAYRESFLNALARGGTSSSRGFFINSCYAHCQSEMQETFMQPDSPVLDSTSIATAIGDWYFDRKPFQKIDCPYPCDKTCHNRIFNGGNDGDGGGSGGA